MLPPIRYMSYYQKKYTGQNNEKLYAEKKDFDDIAEILAKYTKLDKKNSIEILE